LSNILFDLESSIPIQEITNSGVPSVQAKIKKSLDFWRSRTENDISAYEALSRMWDNVGKKDWTPTSVPWSAAWVSYQYKDIGFKPRAAHYQYIQDVIDGTNSNWYAVSLLKQPNIPLNVGDIVVFPRGTGSPTENAFFYTHGDIVYQANKNGEVVTVGGNLGDKVKISKRLRMEDGKLISPSPYVIALKRKKKAVPLVALLALGGILAWWVVKK
jgi:hypothetical protein